MKNTDSSELDGILENLCEDMQDIALHADDATYQSSNYPTQYTRSNINGLFGEAKAQILSRYRSVSEIKKAVDHVEHSCYEEDNWDDLTEREQKIISTYGTRILAALNIGDENGE